MCGVVDVGEAAGLLAIVVPRDGSSLLRLDNEASNGSPIAPSIQAWVVGVEEAYDGDLEVASRVGKGQFSSIALDRA
jgi:hypothetical protein